MSESAVLASKLATICEVLGLSSSDALELLAEADKAPGRGKARTYTVAEFLPLVEAATTPGARRTYVTYWRKLVEAYGKQLITEVKTSDLERLRIALPNSESAVPRANWRQGYQSQRSAVQAWRKFWAVALADKLVDDNPASRCPMERRRASGRRGLTREEVVALYNAAAGGGDDPELDCLIIGTCLETGARRDGLITLSRGSVNADRQTLLLHEKGNQNRELPITRHTGLYTTAPAAEVVRAWHEVWQEPHPLLPETTEAGNRQMTVSTTGSPSHLKLVALS